MKAASELRELSSEQLRSRMSELKKELLKLHTSAATGVNPTSPGKIKQTRKGIARIITIIEEKEVKK